jgi:FMN phosphatase YigB (HAD superfamily)
MPVPTILSDVGKVLIDFDFSIAARRLAEKSPHPAESVLHCLDDIKLPYEDGRMDDEAFVTAAIERTQFRGTRDEFAQIWCEIFTPNEPLHALLRTLRGKLPMYLLSNTSGLHKDYFLRQFPVFECFTDGVYSYSARCSKPGEEIFHLTCRTLDLDPARTFYIDDLEPNIATARRLGFQCFHYAFERQAELESALADWLTAQRIG